jgi:hypothetical protein
LTYGSLSGAFKLQNGAFFNNGTERWVVTYQPAGAVLTVTRRVPDHFFNVAGKNGNNGIALLEVYATQ